MKVVNVTINEQTYPIQFGYGAIRLLGAKWNLTGYMQVVSKVLEILPKEEQDKEVEDANLEMLSFDNLEIMGDMVLAGIECADPNAEMDKDAVITAFMQDIGMLTVVFQAFMESMPKQRESVDPAARKSTKKKKPAKSQ